MRRRFNLPAGLESSAVGLLRKAIYEQFDVRLDVIGSRDTFFHLEGEVSSYTQATCIDLFLEGFKIGLEVER